MLNRRSGHPSIVSRLACLILSLGLLFGPWPVGHGAVADSSLLAQAKPAQVPLPKPSSAGEVEALLTAVTSDDTARVKMLLVKGADPNVAGAKNWTPLMLAA